MFCFRFVDVFFVYRIEIMQYLVVEETSVARSGC